MNAGQVILALLAAAFVGGGMLLSAREARWKSPLYCIQSRGQLWGGVAGALPSGLTPKCPDSNSYRQEVRRGEARVEQYVTPGWQPRALEQSFLAHDFAQLDGEFVNDGLYEAFFSKNGNKLYYLASRVDGRTHITLSGR